MRYFLAIILAVGFFSGITLQGSYLNYLLIACIGVYVLAPCFVVLLAMVLTARILNKGLKSAFLIWCAFVCSLFLSWVTGTSIHAYQISVVRKYVVNAATLLDDIKAKKGTYPTALPISQLGEPPSLLRNRNSYTTDGKEFRFKYWDPAELNGREFKSSDRQWTYFD